MNFTNKQINTMYQIICNEMERSKNRPIGYIETLQDLEVKFNNEYYKRNVYGKKK